VLDPTELCDGALLGGATCQSLGYDAGTLACDGSCQHDTAGCYHYQCGNNTAEPGEECDGGDLAGVTCLSLGYLGGTLGCAVSCTFDTTSCMAPICGDGVVGAGEPCDDGNVANGDGCSDTCQVESGWSCFGEPSTCSSTCGNGVIDVGEECDGSGLGGATCVSAGFDGGTLLCTATCLLDTSGCYACPDGVCSAAETSCSCPADCGDVCGDGCCTGSETVISCAQDCSCPGIDILGTCFYLIDLDETDKTNAIAQCNGLGTGWGLCTSVQLCQPAVWAYLAQSGCSCTGGAAQCNCANQNVYVHASDFLFSAWLRSADFGDCAAVDYCEESGTETCGAVLCCH